MPGIFLDVLNTWQTKSTIRWGSLETGPLLKGLEKGLPECTGLDSGTDAEQGLMDGEGRCDMVRRHFPAGHHGQVEN